MRLVTSKRAAGAPMTSTCLAPWSRATAVAKLPSGPLPWMTTISLLLIAPSRSKPCITVRYAQADAAAEAEETSSGTLMIKHGGGTYMYSAQLPRR